MNHSESNLNKLFNQCYILLPDLDNSLSKGLFWPLIVLSRGLTLWSRHSMSVPASGATVSPLQCLTWQEGPLQGPRGAAPITSVGPHPSSQRPHGISCATVLHTEGHFTCWLSVGQWKSVCKNIISRTWCFSPDSWHWTQERKYGWGVLERRSS